ncbi:MAG: glycosyltransferase family 4 protein [Flavobacteriaceae bacterium]|nr:glycosyltransferase family 4 protein [Flavobacteriaceae bacterium]
MSKILIIGFVWPEPNSSAAGSRMMQLIELFQKQNWEVYFATTATETNHMVDLNEFEVATKQIRLNHNSFDVYVKQLQPNVVLFDRFMIEEQFGWRVAEQCPDAIRILDTEDLHSLRKTRQEAFKKGIEFTTEMLLTSEIAKRELASIYRCDLTLIISTYEMVLLQDVFKVDESLLCYLPFLTENISVNTFTNFPGFSDRQHFMCIGNFRHEPNWNMVLYLKQTIWPMIRKVLPKAELHIYGSYPSEKVTQLTKKAEGFLVKGWVEDVNEVMQESRVCLAPIRFGAGIKGKFTDAMKNGLPSVTTEIGAEGMCGDLPWGGSVVNTPEEIAASAVQLYENESLWLESQHNGKKIINAIYANVKYQESFITKVKSLSKSLDQHRISNFIGAMLMHHTLKSTKYLSKWIAEKEKSK